MKENVLSMAVKLARVIDDGIERDAALSNIAQVQAAANCPEDALETIANIRLVDIRADALRKSMDNLQTRFYLKKEIMPQMDVWLEKLMEETMSIPDINVRCPKLHAINLLILSRMDYNEKVIALLEQSQNEFIRLENSHNRFKFLYALFQLYKQTGDNLRALSSLVLIENHISSQESVVQQGLMKGLEAYEFWNLKGSNFALLFMQSLRNPEVQSYAYLQLVELLAVGGKIEEADQVAQHLTDHELIIMGKRFIGMGKSIIHSILEMKGAIVNLNKSLYFRDEINKKKTVGPSPVWFSLSVSIVPKKDKKDSDDSESDINEDDQKDEADSVNEEQMADSNNQANNWDEYDWDGYDWNRVRENSKELNQMFCNQDSDDEDGDDDGESWKESSDDDGESWKESSDDDDDGESWKESSDDDDDGESWKESSDDDGESRKDSSDEKEEFPWKKFHEINDMKEFEKLLNSLDNYQKIQKAFLNSFAFKGLPKFIRDKILERINNDDELNLNDVSIDRLFTMTESIPDIVSFNRTLPPSLYQHFIRRLNIFFPIIEEDNYRLVPQKKDRFENFMARQEEIGFDEAFQEVVSQGDYLFAVECSLNYYCSRNKEALVFGYNKIS